jgi:hypothetical protein
MNNAEDLTNAERPGPEPDGEARSGAMAQRLVGHIDAVASSGFIEGWAADLNALEAPVLVSILKDGTEVAWGFANQYRDDLAEANCATGWCAFRLRSTLAPGQLRHAQLSLVDRRTGQAIHHLVSARLLIDGDAVVESVAELLDKDPTVLNDVGQLRACEPIFEKFIAVHGAERFVYMAYGYVLQRPPDDEGLALYTGHLVGKSLTGFRLIAALAESAEFLARRPQLSAPATVSFPFFV